MHYRTHVGAIALAFTGLLLSGCSGEASGNVTATSPSASASTTGNLPTDGAPNVANPITNTSKVESDPCSAATNAEVETLGGKVASTRTDDLGLGKNCAWVFSDRYGTIGAGLTTGNADGLSGIYSQHAHGGLTTFKPQPDIEGYPAVIYTNGGEGRGNCTLAVGVRNDLVYTVVAQLDTQNPQIDNPCAVSTKLAQILVRNLKEM